MEATTATHFVIQDSDKTWTARQGDHAVHGFPTMRDACNFFGTVVSEKCGFTYGEGAVVQIWPR